MFGYTDALILFTSTMVLMISVALGSKNVEDKDGVESAWHLLNLMSEGGNKAATEFHEQLVMLKGDLNNISQSAEEQGNRDLTPDNMPNHHEEDRQSAVVGSTNAPTTAQLNRKERLERQSDPIGNPNIIDTVSWAYSGDVSTSFYLQADATNPFLNNSGAAVPRDNTATIASLGNRPHARHCPELVENPYFAGFPDSSEQNQPLVPSAFESMFDSIPFDDISSLDGAAVDSIPWLWDDESQLP